MPERIYYQRVQLLIQIMPIVFTEGCFALKGGTAINLFVRDMPRLSVDIDLVYLPYDNRETALQKTQAALARIAKNLRQTFHSVQIQEAYRLKPDALRLIINRNGKQVKVELSPVLRGTVFNPVQMKVTKTVETQFGFVEAPVVSIPDLYGGKFCAALDRQHPRDIFDVKLLFDNEGMTDSIRKAAIVYMISHPKPLSELLNPRFKDIQSVFANEFEGMTKEPVLLSVLELTREKLVNWVMDSLTAPEKEFLLSFKKRHPQWNLLGIEGVENMPAVQWKLKNLAGMEQSKHRESLRKLEELLQ